MTDCAAYRGELPFELSQPRPPCFTPDDWDEWVRAEVASCAPAPHSGYCEACTPEYQKVMLRAKRCSHPDVFFDDDEGSPVGIRPQPVLFMPRDMGIAFKQRIERESATKVHKEGLLWRLLAALRVAA